MTTPRPAFEALTPALVGSTITLRSAHGQVTGLLTGIPPVPRGRGGGG